jgi:pimeloyl-ACP methyl ester carboxylesterase
MPLHADADPHDRRDGDKDIVLVMVPGMGMREADFHAKGLIAAVDQRGWPVAVVPVDPGVETYLDGSVEARLLDGIDAAQRSTGAGRVWLAGISLGCQAILRCVRARPGLAEGLLLLTPYLASTGLIAEIAQAGGLRDWAAANRDRDQPDRAFLTWLATAPMPRALVGRALDDRFAGTATLLEDLLRPGRVVNVAGAHDWISWDRLWRLMLEQDPFGQQGTSIA